MTVSQGQEAVRLQTLILKPQNLNPTAQSKSRDEMCGGAMQRKPRMRWITVEDC